MTKHDGCAYSTVECWKKGCKLAELCPGGHQVYRNWTGGGHHHEETSFPIIPNGGSITFMGPKVTITENTNR